MAEAVNRMRPRFTDEEENALTTFRQQLLDEGIITPEGDSLGTQYDHILLYVPFFLPVRLTELILCSKPIPPGTEV